MASGRGIVGNVPQAHKAADGEARIVVIIDNEDPIELLDFTASLTAIAREHEAIARARSPAVDMDETRLLVVDVRKGSIVLELLPMLAPMVLSMEYTNTAVEFVKHLSGMASALIPNGGRLLGGTTQQLRNMNDMVSGIVKDSNGKLSIAAKYQNGNIIQELVIQKDEAANILENSTEQRRELVF